MSRGPEARLARALQAEVGPARLVSAESREWLSATFAGRRHRLDVVLPADAGRRLACLAPERLAVPGQIVAGLAVVAVAPAGRDVALTLDVLTVLPC